MQIVIDIDDKVYGLLKYFEESLGLDDKKDGNDDVKTALMRAVLHGISLPKGHGRLIDVDALFPTLPDEELISRMSVQYAPVILEADTEKRDATEQNIKALTRIKENYERLWEENLLSEDLVREEYEAVCAGIDALTKTI